ncbi:MAG TPA: DMT family transporter [Anaerovoracaceae bacterium]|nr:DMT family transporter [Anaerovoracaceae bacterium]
MEAKNHKQNHKLNRKDQSGPARAVLLALLAAALFGVCAPVSKVLLAGLPPAFMAALLYLGAGFGMLLVRLTGTFRRVPQAEAKMTRKELPYAVAMILLDIAAPIFLMAGLTMTAASTASLLNNFEIVATAAIAMVFFKEPLDKRMWLAILLITIACVILSVEDFHSLSLSVGAVFVIAACLCWGIENNCTRMLSLKDPLQIVIIKGFGSGTGALLIALGVNEIRGSLTYILLALLLGFVSYGLSIYFYIAAQRELGAARTSIYYAAAPFIGVLISWIALRDAITGSFLAALAIMIAGTYLAISEKHKHSHIHVEETHEHRHRHDDSHHNHNHDREAAGQPGHLHTDESGLEHDHRHDGETAGEHSHVHTHEALEHTHAHTPELHHRHKHAH